MLDEPDECDILGVKVDCYHIKDKVTKEIIKVSEQMVSNLVGR